MRKLKKLILLLGLALLVNNFASAREEKYVIESQLFKGTRGEEKSEAEVTISTYSEPFIFLVQPSTIESEKKFISHLKDELSTIYQLKNVEIIASGSMIWDGIRENLSESVLLERLGYFIRLSPKILKKNNVNLRIVISKYTWEKLFLDPSKTQLVGKGKVKLGLFNSGVRMSISGASIEKVLNTEIVMKLNEPLVLGFPSNGDPYFLSLFISKKDLSKFIEVGGVEGGVIGGVKGGVIGGVKGGVIGGVEGGVEEKVKGGVTGGVLGGVVSGAKLYASIRAIDPVCGKKVGRGTGFEKENRAEEIYKHKGKTYFFCSKECLEKFKKNPEKYKKKSEIKSKEVKIKPGDIKIKPVKSEIKPVKVRIEPIETVVRPEVDITFPKPILRVKPVYPEKCKKEKIEGSVILEVAIDEEGDVISARILKSVHPDLDRAAKDAIKKWKYKPIIKGGKPFPAEFAVTVNFWLRENK